MPVRVLRAAIMNRDFPGNRTQVKLICDIMDALDDDLKDIGYEPSEKMDAAMLAMLNHMSPTKPLVVGKIAGALPGGPDSDVNAIAPPETQLMIPPDVIARDIAAAEQAIIDAEDAELDAAEDEEDEDEDETE